MATSCSCRLIVLVETTVRLLVAGRPAGRGQQVGDRLSGARAGLHQGHATLVVPPPHLRQHGALARTILIALVQAREGAARPGQRLQLGNVQRLQGRWRRRLHHHVERARHVVDDGAADALLVQLAGHSEVGVGGLQHSGGMVVQHDLAGAGVVGGGEHGRAIAPRHRARIHDHPAGGHGGEKADFAPARARDLFAHVASGLGREDQVGPGRRRFGDHGGEVRSLGARGQTPPGIRAASHPRWSATLGVVLGPGSAAPGPSRRVAIPGLLRSRCSSGLVHGLGALVPAVAAVRFCAAFFGPPGRGRC